MRFTFNFKARIFLSLLMLVVCFGLLTSTSEAARASGSASIKLSPTSGPPLTSVKISGTGFGENESITITFDGRSVASTTSSGTGTFSTRFNVPINALPSNYAGRHIVKAMGQKSRLYAKALFTVQTNWSLSGFDVQDSKFNVLENMIGTVNASGLSPGSAFNTTGRYPGSCPTIANGIVYMGASDGNLYALNAYTAAEKWSFAIGNRYTAASCPAIANNIVYIGSNSGSLYALNASTGVLLWSVNNLVQIESSPVVVNGVLYISSFDNNLYAFNAKTGAKLWNFTSTSALTSTSAVFNGILYLGAEDDNLYALNASTGAKLWSFATGGAVSSPTVANGIVYAGSQDGNLYALTASSGAKLWSFATGGAVGSPAVGSGIVYVGSQDGNLYALDASSGAKMWSSANSGSLALANGVIYSASDNGTLYALDAVSGSLLGSYNIGAPISSPAVVNGIVYIVQLSNLKTLTIQG